MPTSLLFPGCADDAQFMQRALLEGRRALPACLPNPPVGCVLARRGEVIASGFTQAPGEHHAEAMALAQIEGDLSDVTAFVTLEPCSFHGRTPACAKTLVARGVKRVVVATLDPDPRNSGAGIEIMRAAGIEVNVGVLEGKALEDLGPYLALTANNRQEEPPTCCAEPKSLTSSDCTPSARQP